MSDWADSRDVVLRLIDAGDLDKLREPHALLLLRDMQDSSLPDFSKVRDKLKQLKLWTEFAEALKPLKYKQPAAAPLAAIPADGARTRKQVFVTNDLGEMADDVLDSLRSHPDIFVSNHRLVRVVPSTVGGARIAPFTEESLAEPVSTLCDFITAVETKHGIVYRHERIPHRLLEAILCRTTYATIRPLLGVVTSPIARPDGSVRDTYGYDEATYYFTTYAGPPIPIPGNPTREDALRAKDALFDLVSDFPFADSALHFAVWLAALLTCLLRALIDGPRPLNVVTGNAPGTGKTLLVDIIVWILTGLDCPRRAYSKREGEMDATLTSILASGRDVALFDNVEAGADFGSGSLDALLTSRTMEARLYGANDQTVETFNTVVIFVTGNQLALRGDSFRRVVAVVLDTEEERPDQRDDVKIKDIRTHTLAHRTQLLGHAFTIYRAYAQAGSPQSMKSPMGSFFGWSRCIRDLVLWLGLKDPVESGEHYRTEANAKQEALLTAWEEHFGFNTPVTITAALARIKEIESREYREGPSGNPMEGALLQALRDLGVSSFENTSAISLGKKFTQFKRPIGGRKFVSVKINHMNAWKVVPCNPDGTEMQSPTPSPSNQSNVVRLIPGVISLPVSTNTNNI